MHRFSTMVVEVGVLVALHLFGLGNAKTTEAEE